MRDTADCVFCERDRLRGEFSLAEEGLANAIQETGQYKCWWERDSASLSKTLNELSLVRAIKKDLQADNATLRRQNERLASALFRHICYCGCGDPNHELHREDCAYRVACTPHSKTD